MKTEILIKEKLKEKDNIMQMWAFDLKQLTDNKKFDEYSWSGKRKIAKLSKKYTPMISEIEKEIKRLEAEDANS